MPGISRFSPAGFVYVISANRPADEKGRPEDGRYFTKVGCSKKAFQSVKGRCDTANFWLLALGLGQVNVHADEAHVQAWHVERALKQVLASFQNATEFCGKSTESFNVHPDIAVTELSRLLAAQYSA